MSFSISGTTITQSGTDTSLAGLNGLAGVTRIANGDGFIYSMPTILLRISGTLTVADPSKETYDCFAVRVLSGGNYTSGTLCSDGVTPKTAGVHFRALGVTSQTSRSNNQGAFEVQSGGQAKIIGGSYYISGGVAYMSGATNVEDIETTVVASRAYGASSARFYYGTPNVSKTNCKHYDIGCDLFQKPAAGRPFLVKAFGAEYVSQYVGTPNGGSTAKLTAYALSNQDGTYDFDNYDGGWVELYNCAKGASLNVVCQANRTYHCVPLFQVINFKVTNLSGVVQQNARFRCIDAPVSNSPTTTITTDGSAKTWDFRNPLTYTGTTDANGAATSTPVLQVWHGSTNLKNLRFPASTATYRFCAYALEQQDVNVVLGSDTAIQQQVAMTEIQHLTLTESAAAALTGIALSASGATGGTVTITGSVSMSDMWHYYRQWKAAFANFGSDDTWTFDGVTLNIGNWTVTVSSGATLSGVYDLVGNITIANGVSVPSGTFTNLFLTSSQALTGVTVTGTLTISDASTSWTISGNSSINNIINADAAHNLVVNLTGGATASTTEAGTGNGLVTIQTIVTLTVAVLDDSTGLPIQDAHVWLGRTSDKVALISAATNASGVVTAQVPYVGTTDVLGWARQTDLIGNDYITKDFSGQITASGFATTVRLTPIT